MDRDTLRSALEAATRQVLEEAAFLFTEPSTEPIDKASWPGSVIQVQLAFTGPIRGHFMLAASPELCSSLAVEMLGAEPGEPEAEAQFEDAVGEILNMVAGLTLDQAIQGKALWELGVPEARSMSPGEYLSGPRSDVRVRLDTDEEEPVEVAIFIEEGGR